MPHPPYFVAMRDYGAHGWDTLPLAATPDALHDVLTDSFDGYDGMPADLTTCQVWHFTADSAPRDVTEDVLTKIGKTLSARMDAADFPDAFLSWADSDVQDAAADRLAREWAAEQNAALREVAA